MAYIETPPRPGGACKSGITMNKLFYLATVAAFALVPFASHAADVGVPTKAPPSFFGKAGWFVGLDSAVISTDASVSSPTLGASGNITTAGGAIGPVAGYHSGTEQNFWEGECYAHWRNLGGNQVGTGSAVSSQYDGGCKIKVGGTSIFATLGQLLPNLGLQGVFTNAPVVGQGSMGYFSGGFDVRPVQASIVGVTSSGVQVAPTIGTGFISKVMDPTTGKETGWVTDTSLDYSSAGQGKTFGGNGDATLGRVISAHFAIKRPL